METFLVLNGFELKASTDEQAKIVLRLAAGKLEREKFTEWLRAQIVEKSGDAF